LNPVETSVCRELTNRRPLHPETGEALAEREQPGYYPGFSTLAQRAFWDEATRRKVTDRLYKIPSIRFFTPEELPLMELISSHILPQDDRMPSRRIPIVPWIDERLHAGRTSGYRFARMPPDGEAYRLGFQAIEKMAMKSFGGSFRMLSWYQQEKLLKSIHDAEPEEGAAGIWERMPVEKYWKLVVQDCIESYYAHPWAWDEIGFGGPAYPRGYMRLEHGDPEPWEVEELRYAWDAPGDSLSDLSDPRGDKTIVHRVHPEKVKGGMH
jgi:hypothetical protein